MSNSQTSNIHDEENYDPTVWVPKAHSHGTKDIWRVFWILAVLTIADIILYFTLPPSMARNLVFVGLGIVKAVYIVGTFMHLKHERIALILIIVLPVFFIIFFIIWMLYEGNFWLNV